MKRPFFTMPLGAAIIFVTAAAPPAQARLELEPALAKARALVSEGNARQLALEQITLAVEKEENLLRVIESVVNERRVDPSKFDVRDIDGLPGVAGEVKKKIAALEAEVGLVRDAQEALSGAVRASESVAARVCELARQSPKASEDQIKTWQAEANSLISQASDQLNAAQNKIETEGGAAEELAAARAALASYEKHLSALKVADVTTKEFEERLNWQWQEANRAEREAAEKFKKVSGLVTELRRMFDQVFGLLEPFQTNSEAAVLIVRAKQLTRVKEPTRADLEPRRKKAREELEKIVATIKKIEQLAAAADIPSVIAAADSALDMEKKTRALARSWSANPERYSSLQRASKCLAEIQFSGPEEEDEIAVPDLSVFESVTEMKAVLAHAGLTAALVAAKDKAPSKEKEFKFAGQDPAPNTKVKGGSTVSIAFYQKFEPTETTVSEGDDIVGHWVGTITWPGGKGSDPMEFDIQRQGDGYVLTSKATENKSVPATYSGGKLYAVSQGTVKSAGLKAGVSMHIELTREGETLSGTFVYKAANGEAGKPARLVLTRRSK